LGLEKEAENEEIREEDKWYRMSRNYKLIKEKSFSNIWKIKTKECEKE